MKCTRAWMLALLVALPATARAAAPAAPSFRGVTKVIEEVRADWADREGGPPANAEGWNPVFDTLTAQLERYSTATTEDERLRALDRLFQISSALAGVSWQPAQDIRNELRAWLRPRVTLAWSVRRLTDALGTTGGEGNGSGWDQFVRGGLSDALTRFEGAKTVSDQLRGLDRLRTALDVLNKTNQTSAWNPSQSLESALLDLYSVRNLDITIDPTTLTNAIARSGGVVEPGPIAFKGQVSYVTPGPITSIGFLPYEGGIALTISQVANSYTPIQGFEQQVAEDSRGRIAAKLYDIGASSTNNSIATIQAVFQVATGISLAPMTQSSVGATVSTAPQSGKGFGRALLGLLGQGQEKITETIYEKALPQIQQQVSQGSQELAQIKAAQKAAQINAQIAQYVRNANTVSWRNLGVTNLAMSSQPAFARVLGTAVWIGPSQAVNAYHPQPPEFRNYQTGGVTLDVHLPTVAETMTAGYLLSEAAKDVENIMVITGEAPPGTPPGQQIEVRSNIDFPTYLQEVIKARESKDVKKQAIRVLRPESPPRYGTDSEGNLVVIVPNFAIDVPAPEGATQGGPLTGPPAQVYRIMIPEAELVVALTIDPAQGGKPAQIKGNLVAFNPSPGARVLAINKNPDDAPQLNAFTATVVANAFGTRLKAIPINASLEQLRNQGVAVTSASALDPSGWMRLIVVPTQ